MLYNRFSQNKKGFATLEMLIAFSILTMALTTVIMITFGSQSVLVDTQTNGEALYKAQGMLENGRASLSENFYALASIAPVADDIYTKTLNIDWIDDYVKKITSRVTWNTEQERPQYVELTTIITSPENASRGDTCDPEISGDWAHPQVLGYVDIVSNEGATDIDTRLHKVYLTTNPSAAGQDDFYVVDTTDPTNPSIISQINTGNGLESVKVVGDYAYVANRSINAQLQIIDISNPLAPFVAASLKMPGVTGSAYGKSVFYLNKKIYLGLYKADTGSEFNVIDVSNPLNPVYLGGWRATTTVNDIYVRDNVAYLATPQPDPGTEEEENLSILDITNPASIVRINTFTALNATIQSGENFFFKGNTLYFGRSDGGKTKPNNRELFILDVSDPFSSIGILGFKKIGSGVNASIVRENLLFIMASDPNEGFQIWDVSNSSNPVKYASLNVQQAATGGFDCEGNTLYIAQRSNRALQIIGPDGGGVGFDYVLTNSGDITMARKESKSNTIIKTLVSGITTGVTLSISGLPANTTGVFTSNPCDVTCSSVLTITTKNNTPLGTFNITVTGSPDGTGPRMTVFTLKVQ